MCFNHEAREIRGPEKEMRGGRVKGCEDSGPKQAAITWGLRDENERDSDRKKGSSCVTLRKKFLLPDLFRQIHTPPQTPSWISPPLKKCFM